MNFLDYLENFTTQYKDLSLYTVYDWNTIIPRICTKTSFFWNLFRKITQFCFFLRLKSFKNTQMLQGILGAHSDQFIRVNRSKLVTEQTLFIMWILSRISLNIIDNSVSKSIM